MKKLLVTIAILACSAGLRAQRLPQITPEAAKDATVQLQKFSQFYRYLNASYIDNVENDKVIERAIKDILAELDPHSSYISPEDMVGVSESFEGKFSGIGVQINTLEDTIRVAGVITGGPSEKVGIIPNDRIVSVDGTSVVGKPQSEAVKMMRGPKGTQVNIGIVRSGEKEMLDFRIIRDDISIETIDAAYNPAPGVGYIRVNRFAHTTMKEFREAFYKLGGPQSLILDLRGNGGGIMGQSIEMANFFLPRGYLVVSTEGRAVPDEQYEAPVQGAYLNGKVVVLIDDFSASASEIVAGALQDWDRAVIVGRRSFGKGLVQRQFPLLDGSAVNITISKYLTPTGRAIQRPFENGKEDDYYSSFTDRFTKGYIDSLSQNDSLRYTTLRLKKNVYGGGGIYPDYYVAADTTGYTSYMSALVRKGVIYEYTNTYLDRNRNTLLTEYPDFEKFLENYTITPDMIDALAALGEQRDVPVDIGQLETSRSLIEKRLKTYVARNLWGESEAYRIANIGDPIMNKALEVLQKWDEMASGIATGSI